MTNPILQLIESGHFEHAEYNEQIKSNVRVPVRGKKRDVTIPGVTVFTNNSNT